MKKEDIKDKTMKFAQGCDSKDCKHRYRNELTGDQCPTTAHELNFKTKEITCLICNKVSKYRG